MKRMTQERLTVISQSAAEDGVIGRTAAFELVAEVRALTFERDALANSVDRLLAKCEQLSKS